MTDEKVIIFVGGEDDVPSDLRAALMKYRAEHPREAVISRVIGEDAHKYQALKTHLINTLDRVNLFIFPRELGEVAHQRTALSTAKVALYSTIDLIGIVYIDKLLIGHKKPINRIYIKDDIDRKLHKDLSTLLN